MFVPPTTIAVLKDWRDLLKAFTWSRRKISDQGTWSVFDIKHNFSTGLFSFLNRVEGEKKQQEDGIVDLKWA